MTAAQGALGIGQTIAGMVKKKPAIPEYDIPQEIYENMTDAEYWAMQGLPDAQREQFIQESKRTGATALSRSASRKGGLGLVSSIAQQERDDATNLLTMDAQARMSNLDRVFQARENVARHKDIKYEMDKEDAMREREERDELIGSGLQNIMGSGATFAAMDAQSDSEGGIFEDLFGSKEDRLGKRADRRANRDWRKNQ